LQGARKAGFWGQLTYHDARCSPATNAFKKQPFVAVSKTFIAAVARFVTAAVLQRKAVSFNQSRVSSRTEIKRTTGL